ncbi:MAG: glycogen synthase GlgA [Opitutae bacterium]|nr:glycogen synthase GlgA [Opitutae bacterium]
MKVLLISPEVSPLSKTGGLGDVAGALPQALRDIGVDARVLCPLYGDFEKDFLKTLHPIGPMRVNIGRSFRTARVQEGIIPGTDVPAYFLEHKSSFGRSGIYSGPKGNFPDNAERFLLLAKSALELPELTGWWPNALHLHDWTVALTPAFLNALPPKDRRRQWASILTIHNLMHQGVFPAETLNMTGLPNSYYNPDGLEHDGCLNMLKGGIHHATKITTVSPSYAREIQEEPLSQGLGHTLRHRAADLLGIVNGIDCEEWNPKKDAALTKNYSISQMDAGKLSCKANLLEELRLPSASERPLFFVVSRMDHQKGLDLLANVLPRLVKEHDMTFALLGSGDPNLENTYRSLASEYHDNIAAVIGFDECLARKMFAGGDFLVVPSRFEPCGLTQLYAMRYGTVPVVRRTGGLADTVIPWSEDSPDGTGIAYEGDGEWELLLAIEQALEVFAKKQKFQKLRKMSMKRDSSWGPSARAYSQAYSWAIEVRKEQI